MEYKTDFLVDAKKLINRPIQTKQIKEYVVSLLQSIWEEISHAYHEGKNHIITDLPIMFDISNMSNKNSQRVIFSEIIKTLKKKNYRVEINITKNSCKIKITWLSKEDEDNIKSQTEIVNKHSRDF